MFTFDRQHMSKVEFYRDANLIRYKIFLIIHSICFQLVLTRENKCSFDLFNVVKKRNKIIRSKIVCMCMTKGKWSKNMKKEEEMKKLKSESR